MLVDLIRDGGAREVMTELIPKRAAASRPGSFSGSRFSLGGYSNGQTSALAVCVLGALAYDIAYWLDGW
jgi:hypothetical protein